MLALAACGGGGSSSSAVSSAPAVTLKSIAVTPAAPSVAIGSTTQFVATGTYSDSTTQVITSSVSWTSGTPAAATIVGTTGLATGVAVGTSTITATMGSVTGTTTLTVTAATAVSLTVTPSNLTGIAVNRTQQFVATVTNTDSTMSNVTSSVTWNSATLTVATIESGGTAATPGLALGVAPGTTNITATYTLPSGAVLTSTAVVLTVTASAEFAYAVNFNDNDVSQYSVGAGGVLAPLYTTATSGTATPINTVLTGTQPFSITIDPSARYAYVANYTNKLAGTVSQYQIALNGQLTALSVPTAATGVGPNSITIDRTDSFVYVANYGDATVSQYTISTGTATAPAGALVPMTAPTVAAGMGAASVVIDPTANFAYVANYIGDTISQYSVAPGNASTPGAGALTPLATATVTAGDGPNSVVVDPTGKYAYAANVLSNTVSQYTIGADGTLTAMTPATVATGAAPFNLTVDPSGKYVYVANRDANTVSQFNIGTGGALVALTPATVATGSGPSSVAVDALGQFVYVTNRGTVSSSFTTLVPATTVSQFSIGAGGVLTPISPPTVATGRGPVSIATTIN